MYLFANSLLRNLRAFFSPTSTRRLHILRSTASLLDIPYREIQAIFEVRWTASLRRAVHNLLGMCPAIMHVLEVMTSPGEDFDRQSKIVARALHFTMSDPRVYVFLHFFADAMKTLEVHSVLSQKKQGTVFGMKAATDELVSRLAVLKNMGSLKGAVYTSRLFKLQQHRWMRLKSSNIATGLRLCLYTTSLWMTITPSILDRSSHFRCLRGRRTGQILCF